MQYASMNIYLSGLNAFGSFQCLEERYIPCIGRTTGAPLEISLSPIVTGSVQYMAVLEHKYRSVKTINSTARYNYDWYTYQAKGEYSLIDSWTTQSR